MSVGALRAILEKDGELDPEEIETLIKSVDVNNVGVLDFLFC